MAIEIKHLNHIYGQGTIFEQYALKDVNLTIHDGEFIGLIGHTGSGKSTLTQHLNGLLKATSGDILGHLPPKYLFLKDILQHPVKNHLPE